jgi:glycosyltransferase involved in cell wall biosynthesis
MMEPSPVVLATSDYYLPGDKGGGAVHALANMVTRLGENWAFKIITRDRDFGDAWVYPHVTAGRWCRQGKADVMYLSPLRRLRMLLASVRKTEFDVLYLNSFFSPAFSFPLLLFRKLGVIAERPLIVAPRGEFSPGALRLKRVKKLGYIFLIRALGLCRDAVWHVSTEYEEADVRRYFGGKAQVVIARDCLPLAAGAEVEFSPREKVAGELDIVFLSRICRKKNLDGALSMLSDLQGTVRMRIYGPQEDVDYWRECQAIIDRLPANIQVEYCGAVAHDEVSRVMALHHLFVFPTHGENFGFVIFEALLAGCPILISDQTPWRDLKTKRCGWEFPLAEPERFREALQACVDMDQTAFSDLSQNARAFGLETVRDDPSVAQSIMLFKTALG